MIKLIKTYLINFHNSSQQYPHKLDDYIFNSKTVLLTILLFMSTIIMIVFGIISFQNNVHNIAETNTLGGAAYLILLILLIKTLKTDLISYVYAFVLGTQLLYLMINGGISSFGYVWTLLYPLGTLFFFGSRKGLIVSLIFLIIATLLLFTISVYKYYGIEFQLRYIGIYSAVTIIAYTYDIIREKLNDIIIDQNTELKIKLSDLQKKDNELLIAKEKAENADRLKSEFLAQMSHEIRTPINTILNYSWLIQDELKEIISTDLQTSFSSINKASNRLTRTIDMILDLSVIEADTYSPKFEEILVSKDIIQILHQEFDQTAKLKNLQLIFQNDIYNEAPIIADKYTLTQALANLIDNAIKYTKEGYIKIDVEFQHDCCKINVSDSGIGISEEYIPRLFEKFSQETEGYSRQYEGSGLGLALVKKYCEVNKAEINVTSKKGIGTTFTLTMKLNGKLNK